MHVLVLRALEALSRSRRVRETTPVLSVIEPQARHDEGVFDTRGPQIFMCCGRANPLKRGKPARSDASGTRGTNELRDDVCGAAAKGLSHALIAH